MTKQRHLRVGDRLEDDETIVIRGGGLEPGALRTDAQRCHTVYGHYGISVFAVRDAAIDEMAQQVPLSVSRSSRSCMSACCGPLGLRLEPTGRNPRHFTVAFDELDPGIEVLVACDHRRWTNPYRED